jgi:hypothetical protein
MCRVAAIPFARSHVPEDMHAPRRLAPAVILLALAAAGPSAMPASALADAVVVADPTARNVTAYGVTSAWSRRASDGTYRLVVMGASGIPDDADARSSSVPFDPDLGPTSENQRVILYSRCASGSATRVCDIWLYDIATRRERKVTSFSSRGASEIGPSYFKGTVAFGRTGARAGLYVARPGKGAKRIVSGSFAETDLSATRVIAQGSRSGESIVRLSYLDGSRARIVGRGMGGEEATSIVTSPVLSRYRAFWLHRTVEARTQSAIVQTVSTRSLSDTPHFVDRPLASASDAIALGSASIPQLFSGSGGISKIDPRLTYAP